MSRKYVWATFMLMLCACVQQASATGDLIDVTKKTQAKVGIDYKLVAERVDSQAVLVTMEIPLNGKLKGLRSVSMSIGKGRPQVAARLFTEHADNGSLIVRFQVSPEMANKCYVNLTTPGDPPKGMSYLVYAVELKGYVTGRK